MILAAICEVFNVGPTPKKNPVEIRLEAHRKEYSTEKDKTVIPGEEIQFVAKVYNKGIDCYLRIGIKLIDENTNEVRYLNDLNKDLEKHGDYYYLNRVFKAKETIDIFKSFTIPEDIREKIDSNELEIEIVAQAIQAKDFEPDYTLKDPWKNIIPEDNTKKTYYILDSLELEEDKKEENQIDLSIIIFIISAICLVSIMIAYGIEKKKNEDNNV